MATAWVARGGVASTSASSSSRGGPAHVPHLQPVRRRRQGRGRAHLQTSAVAYPATASTDEKLRQHPRPAAMSRPPLASISDVEETALPIYITLDEDILKPAISKVAYIEALKSGLKAMRLLGVTGVVVELYWGAVESQKPESYDWSAYREVLQLVRDEGFTLQVALCFHSNEQVQLPGWVLDEGLRNPDIYFTDRAGSRSLECLTFGVDDVPVLAGRSAVAAYKQFVQSFKEEFGSWLGTAITDVVIGLGPAGELRYPSHPRDRRWNFPGIGEFQCYDKYMLATLKACTQQVNQPSWGLGGPHDAGNYCLWPHQTGFFHQHGNWCSPYGAFFLQWYSEMMMRHADMVLGATLPVLRGTGARLHVKVPCVHWWYHTVSHAAECTAGYYNTLQRDGYLPVFKVLEGHGVGVHLRTSEMRSQEAFCDPERLIAQQRLSATALHMPVSLHSSWPPRYDEQALSRLEAAVFDTSVVHGVELAQIRSLVLHRLSDSMFEPGAWGRVKSFVGRVRDRAATLVVANGRGEGGGGGARSMAGAGVKSLQLV